MFQAGESEVVKVGDLIGVLALPGEDWKSVSVPTKADQAVSNPVVAADQGSHSSHKHYDGYL